MSGIDVSERQKENQVNMCESCMTSVVQTFRHLQDQICQLKKQKVTLQLNHEKQMQVLTNKIRMMEEKLVALKDQ